MDYQQEIWSVLRPMLEMRAIVILSHLDLTD
jgi:hypothetical protein